MIMKKIIIGKQDIKSKIDINATEELSKLHKAVLEHIGELTDQKNDKCLQRSRLELFNFLNRNASAIESLTQQIIAIEEEINNAIKKLKEQKEKTVTKEYFFAGQKFEALVFCEQEINSQMAFLYDIFTGTVGDVKVDSVTEVKTPFSTDADYVYATGTAKPDDLIFSLATSTIPLEASTCTTSAPA